MLLTGLSCPHKRRFSQDMEGIFHYELGNFRFGTKCGLMRNTRHVSFGEEIVPT